VDNITVRNVNFVNMLIIMMLAINGTFIKCL